MRRQRYLLTTMLLMATLIPTIAHSLIYLDVDVDNKTRRWLSTHTYITSLGHSGGGGSGFR